jgi:hypothetical protein
MTGARINAPSCFPFLIKRAGKEGTAGTRWRSFCCGFQKRLVATLVPWMVLIPPPVSSVGAVSAVLSPGLILRGESRRWDSNVHGCRCHSRGCTTHDEAGAPNYWCRPRELRQGEQRGLQQRL